MAEKIKLQGGWIKYHTSHHQAQGLQKRRKENNGKSNQKLQPVVPWLDEWCLRRPLSVRRQKWRLTNKFFSFLHSFADSRSFLDSTAAQQNILLADLAAGETAREGAVTGNTHTDQAQAWSIWENYCVSIRIFEDDFLNHFTGGQRIRTMGAFAMDLREGIFSGPSHGTLVERAIRVAISYVSQTFRKNDWPNPTKDEDNKLGRFLLRQYRA